MKALSTTILIVVTAVVILVAALVLLTIFGGGIGNVATIANFKNNCLSQCQSTCSLTSALPPSWSAKVTVQGSETSCAGEFLNQITNCDQCLKYMPNRADSPK